MNKHSRKITKSALFAAVISISAYIKIPVGVVPLTLQSPAVLIAGYCLGIKYGAFATIIYTAVGLAGLPVFASGGGPAYVLSPTFGYITTTPKPGWANIDFAGTVVRALNVPVGFDTDANVAALGEGRWGAAQGLDTFIYLTIGTGIGGGGMVDGRLMHGLIHPEMGHIPIPHDREKDPYPGWCPYHGDC